MRELIVVKKNGRREPFDRDKLERSINHALRKRPVERERIDRMITGIVRRLESMGENEIPSNVIGELVMQALSSLDKVAYVRFASVYKNFRETKDFESSRSARAGRRRPWIDARGARRWTIMIAHMRHALGAGRARARAVLRPILPSAA